MKGSPLAGARGLELYPAGVYKAISIRVEKNKVIMQGDGDEMAYISFQYDYLRHHPKYHASVVVGSYKRQLTQALVHVHTPLCRLSPPLSP